MRRRRRGVVWKSDGRGRQDEWCSTRLAGVRWSWSYERHGAGSRAVGQCCCSGGDTGRAAMEQHELRRKTGRYANSRLLLQLRLQLA
jgi:hypothetical protein